MASAALIVTWAISRIEGLPFGADAGHPEAIICEDGTYYRIEDLTTIGSRASICLDADS